MSKHSDMHSGEKKKAFHSFNIAVPPGYHLKKIKIHVELNFYITSQDIETWKEKRKKKKWERKNKFLKNLVKNLPKF